MSKQTRRRKKKKKKVRLWPRILLLLLFFAAAIVAAYQSVVRAPVTDSDSTTAPVAQTGAVFGRNQRKSDYYVLLVSGVDDGNGGSDTNILVSVNAAEHIIHCVSVPRDTLVNVDRNVKKINAAYNIGGTKQLSEEVSQTLGIPIDYTIQVDLKGFVELVDAIGGVDFEVPVNMNYDDPVQGLSIHVQKGMQHLDGETALKVVRFRHNNDGTGYGTEDIGRISTQQAFLKAVAQKMVSSISLSTLSKLGSVFKDSVDTELSVGNLVWLGQEVFAAGADNITFETLPGNGAGYYEGVSYYILYPEEVLAMVNASLNPYTTDRTLSDMDILTG